MALRAQGDFSEAKSAIRDWKSWLVKKHGIEWQRNFFDHRLRH